MSDNSFDITDWTVSKSNLKINNASCKIIFIFDKIYFFSLIWSKSGSISIYIYILTVS